jgi:hypothetical protein
MHDDHKAQLPIILSFLDDARRVIEGGKNRRWEVFKWTIALNLVLATAALAQSRPLMVVQLGLPLLAFVVAVMGGYLIHHHDCRMTSTRHRIRNLAEWIRINALIDMYATMGETKLIPADAKDNVERYFFFGAIGASVLAVALAAALK